LSLIFFASTITFGWSQKVHENKEGNFKVTIPADWTVRVEGSTSDILAPEEGVMDEWSEFVGISANPSEGATLADVFDYYITDDFPGYYPEFKVLDKGEEIVNGVKAKWALYSFTNSTEVSGGSTKSATLNNLFYFMEKNGVFFYLNGIAEQAHYSSFEITFLKIIRSFKPGGM
jgi:hypothetical protein